MNNNNLKRRRPYCHEDSPVEPVLRGTNQSSSSFGIDGSSLAPREHYILEQAASILNVPFSKLLDLDRQQEPHFILEQAALLLDVPPSSLIDLSRRQGHLSKRSRLNSDIPMSAPYLGSPVPQDVPEKSPLDGQPSQNHDTRRSLQVLSEPGSLLSWGGSRLAECFSGFSVCQPSGYESDPGYQNASATASYDYDSGRSYQVQTASPDNERSRDAYVATTGQAEPASLFTCDDPALVAQYMQNFPPLQPSRIAADQPPTRREGMLYPDGLPNNHYFKADDEGVSLATARIRPDPPNANRPAYAGELFGVSASPSVTRQPAIATAPPRYGVLHGYGGPNPLVHDERVSFPMNAKESNLDVVFPNEKPPPAKRGPFKDHSERQKTAQTRKIGSCIRCRMQRIRCNADPEDQRGVCQGCKKVTSKVWRLPCLRLKINDVLLSKPGQLEGYEWTLRWKQNMMVDDIGSWASSDIKTICVTEGYTGKHVELRVRQFIPQEGDRLERSWVVDGVKKSVTIPPYAIVDLEAAKIAYDSYIKKGLVEVFKRLLGPREKLLWQTYLLARKLAGDPSLPKKERDLLVTTLDLWMSIRLTTKSFEIVGEETLGMTKDIMGDSSSPLRGKIPLPPVMGAQIDSVLIHQIQSKLRHDTLENLQKLTTENKQKTWLATYLATFILLHNIALVIKHDAGYARKHGMKRRFAREDKVKQYHLGAVTLLAYFHYCNKGIFPFSEECKDQDLQNLAELDDTAMQFVRYTRTYTTDHKRQWQELWDTDDYENDYYFISQLFEQNWQPRTMA